MNYISTVAYHHSIIIRKIIDTADLYMQFMLQEKLKTLSKVYIK